MNGIKVTLRKRRHRLVNTFLILKKSWETVYVVWRRTFQKQNARTIVTFKVQCLYTYYEQGRYLQCFDAALVFMFALEKRTPSGRGTGRTAWTSNRKVSKDTRKVNWLKQMIILELLTTIQYPQFSKGFKWIKKVKKDHFTQVLRHCCDVNAGQSNKQWDQYWDNEKRLIQFCGGQITAL